MFWGESEEQLLQKNNKSTYSERKDFSWLCTLIAKTSDKNRFISGLWGR